MGDSDNKQVHILQEQKIFDRENSPRKVHFFNSRLDRGMLILLLGFLLIASRMVQIYFFAPHKENLNTLSHSQYKKSINYKNFRGQILDRRKIPLAMSTLSPSIAINPKSFKADHKQIAKLASTLAMKRQEVLRAQKRKGYFSWLKRHVSYKAMNKVKKMRLQGLHIQFEPRRYYPYSFTASQLIGFVGLDHTGLLGIERSHNSLLSASSESFSNSKDARGKLLIIDSKATTNKQKKTMGGDLVLSIDIAIQEIAEKSLYKWAKKANSASGFVLVADPYSGELLAVANYPRFNPNQKAFSSMDATINRAFRELIEPGSVIKPIVLAAAIEERLISSQTIFNCHNGSYYINKNLKITDDHPIDLATASEVIIHSSNICSYKISKLLGKELTKKYYHEFGIANSKSHKKTFGSTKGRLNKSTSWSEIRHANIAFGQGMMTSGIEIITAYNIIANGGKFIKTSIVKTKDESQTHLIDPAEKTVISPQTAYVMREILKKVIDQGTGKNAKPSSYTAAGKTGTSEKFDLESKTYKKDKRIASFAGFAPAHDPRVSIYVVIDEPKNKPYYGGKWAAPVFAEVAEASLKYLNTPIKTITHESRKKFARPSSKNAYKKEHYF